MKRIHLIPIWGSFLILLSVLLFLIYGLSSQVGKGNYKVSTEVTDLRAKERVFGIEKVVGEEKNRQSIKGKKISDLIEQKLVRKEEIYIYQSGAGMSFGIVAKDGIVEDIFHIEGDAIQPVAGADQTR